MLLSALLLAATSASGQGLDALEQRLARTPPVSTNFVEYRFSHLLKKPLRSSGSLEYRADGVVVREVIAPAHETSVVNGEQVRITRAVCLAPTDVIVNGGGAGCSLESRSSSGGMLSGWWSLALAAFVGLRRRQPR